MLKVVDSNYAPSSKHQVPGLQPTAKGKKGRFWGGVVVKLLICIRAAQAQRGEHPPLDGDHAKPTFVWQQPGLAAR